MSTPRWRDVNSLLNIRFSPKLALILPGEGTIKLPRPSQAGDITRYTAPTSAFSRRTRSRTSGDKILKCLSTVSRFIENALSDTRSFIEKVFSYPSGYLMPIWSVWTPGDMPSPRLIRVKYEVPPVSGINKYVLSPKHAHAAENEGDHSDSLTISPGYKQSLS